MKSLTLLLGLLWVMNDYAYCQTNYSTIASNRIVQKHQHLDRLAKIHQLDPQRLQVLWEYLSNSYTFTSNGTQLSITELMNIQQFDVTEFEHLRLSNTNMQFQYRGITITLKSNEDLQTLLQGYSTDELLNKLPETPFPIWTSSTFSEEDFNAYKAKVWAWAKDYPEEYLEVTSDPTRMHIHFQEWQTFNEYRRTQIINDLKYLIID